MIHRLKGMRCYLSGAMDDVKDGGVEWRKEATKILRRLDVGILNPCDKPTAEFVQETEAERSFMRLCKEQGRYDEVVRMGQPIANVDLRMVDIADFLILHIDVSCHMCGSYFEACTAEIQRKPIVVVCKQGKSKIPNWIFWHLKEHDIFFNTLNEVEKYLIHVDSSTDINDLNRWRFFDYDRVYHGPDNISIS